MLPMDLYKQTLQLLEDHILFLQDKPEESAQSTLDALWFAAAGKPLSAAATVGKEIPSLQAEQQIELQRLIDLRLKGTPLAHITGRQQFMGVEMLAGPEALIPRKETEILAQQAIRIVQSQDWHDHNPQILDLCTGAGNVAVVLALVHSKARIFATDISQDCLALAQKNFQMHQVANRVTTVLGDLLAPFSREAFYGGFDLITCNPPYISTSKVGEMAAEIADHEPVQAFDGGPFGIALINRLIQEAPLFLRSGGWLAFEVGLGQGPALIKRMEKKKIFTDIVPVSDHINNTRVLLARR